MVSGYDKHPPESPHKAGGWPFVAGILCMTVFIALIWTLA